MRMLEVTYEPILPEEALELAVRKVLYAENSLLQTHENPFFTQEIDIGTMHLIANSAVDFFMEMVSGTYDFDEVERFRNINTSEELAEEHLEHKERFFGKGKTSCALHLFQTSLTK